MTLHDFVLNLNLMQVNTAIMQYGRMNQSPMISRRRRRRHRRRTKSVDNFSCTTKSKVQHFRRMLVSAILFKLMPIHTHTETLIWRWDTSAHTRSSVRCAMYLMVANSRVWGKWKCWGKINKRFYKINKGMHDCIVCECVLRVWAAWTLNMEKDLVTVSHRIT